jgi:Sec-independent protein secretion pathway component TatC
MLLLAVPVYGLFELGILLLRIAPPSAVADGHVFSRLKRSLRGGRS